MNKNSKILIIPSWYATSDKPNNGSFFKEQSILMEEKYDVSVLFFKKNWISWRRYLYEKLINKTNNKVTPIEITPPKGIILKYNQVSMFSKKLNYKLMLKEFISGFKNYVEKHGKPDLIHAHCTFLGGNIANCLSKSFNIPYIITEHYGPFNLSEFDSFYHKSIKNSLENANKVLAVSNHQKQNILMNRIDCNPILVGNLVDDKRFVILEKDKKYKNDSVIHILIVTFYPNFIKDMNTFFNTLEILAKNNFRFKATIIGGKSGSELDENYYINEIEKRNLNEYCTIIPEANRVSMVNFMQQADIYINTSIAESFGIALCEAMLCGKPVISTKNGGVNDFINKTNGLLVNIKEPIELAREIENLSKRLNNYSPELIRDSIVKKFGRKAFFNRIDKIYQEVLSD